MVKKLFIVLGTILLLVAIMLIWFDQSRSFYCLSENRCITVWKRLGNKCYIIPDKYYGVFNPTDNYIRTTNTQYLTLYFSTHIPKTIIVRNQGNSTGEVGEYEIVNILKNIVEIVDYSEEYKKILYKPNALNFIDVESQTEYIDLGIKENYATDKTGKKLR